MSQNDIEITGISGLNSILVTKLIRALKSRSHITGEILDNFFASRHPKEAPSSIGLPFPSIWSGAWPSERIFLLYYTLWDQLYVRTPCHMCPELFYLAYLCLLKAGKIYRFSEAMLIRDENRMYHCLSPFSSKARAWLYKLIPSDQTTKSLNYLVWLQPTKNGLTFC